MKQQTHVVAIVIPESRRRFLTTTISGLTTLMALLLGIPSAIYLFRPKEKGKASGWMDAGAIATSGSGLPREITFRNNRIDGWKIRSEMETAWLSHDEKGELLAFAPWCTHLGCAYRWEARTGEFNCPCHGSRFAKDGDVIAGPAARPLDRYEIKVIGKRIWLSPTQPAQSS